MEDREKREVKKEADRRMLKSEANYRRRAEKEIDNNNRVEREVDHRKREEREENMIRKGGRP